MKIKSQVKVQADNGLIIAVLTGITVCFIIFNHCLFGNNYFWSDNTLSDLVRANLPTYCYIYDNFTLGWSFWSWEMGIGTSIFSHADALFDPFTYISFIAGRNHIADMLVWVLICKIIAEIVSIYLLLHYLKINNYGKIIGSIIYGFSGYSIILGSNLALGTILVYFPLLLLGIEKWLHENKKGLMLASLTLIAVWSLYYYYSAAIMSLVIVIILTKEKDTHKKRWIFSCAKYIIFEILSALLASFSLFPQFLLLIENPRVSGKGDYNGGLHLFIPNIKVLATYIARLFGNDIIGSTTDGTYIGTSYINSDYFECTSYASILSIIALLLLLKYNKELRKRIVLFLLVAIVMIIEPFISFILNGFSTLYGRWMYVLTIIICILIAFSMNMLPKMRKIENKDLLEILILSYLILFISILILCADLDLNVFKNNIIVYFNNTWNNLIEIFLIGGSLALTNFIYNIYNQNFARKSKTNNYLFFVLLLIIAIDIVHNYKVWLGEINLHSIYTKEGGNPYNDSTTKIVDIIQNNDDGIYRIDRNYDSVYSGGIPSYNDAMVQHYRGITSYNSQNNPNYITFLKSMGIYCGIGTYREVYVENQEKPENLSGQALNYISGVENDEYLESYLGVKYFLNNTQTYDKHSDNKSNDEIEVLVNDNAYPIAFVNEGVISLDDFYKLNYNDRRKALMTSTVIDDKIESENYVMFDKYDDIHKLAVEKNSAIKTLSFHNDEITFNIKIDDDNNSKQYLSTTIPYDKNWKIYIDNKMSDSIKVNISMLGTKISPGNHNVKIKYVPTEFFNGLIISLLVTFLLVLKTKLNSKMKIDIKPRTKNSILI